jgi:hypothetical protein
MASSILWYASSLWVARQAADVIWQWAWRRMMSRPSEAEHTQQQVLTALAVERELLILTRKLCEKDLAPETDPDLVVVNDDDL